MRRATRPPPPPGMRYPTARARRVGYRWLPRRGTVDDRDLRALVAGRFAGMARFNDDVQLLMLWAVYAPGLRDRFTSHVAACLD